jgi:hypothetical protein
MNKLILFTVTILAVASVQAQNKDVQNKPQEKAYIKKSGNFSSTTKSNSGVEIKKQSLLEELYLIEDERQRIENNESLSSSERSQKIQSNNTEFNKKREEFKNYISSKGILNATKQEQNYYLSILKSGGDKTEYSKNIELINNSK